MLSITNLLSIIQYCNYATYCFGVWFNNLNSFLMSRSHNQQSTKYKKTVNAVYHTIFFR